MGSEHILTLKIWRGHGGTCQGTEGVISRKATEGGFSTPAKTKKKMNKEKVPLGRKYPTSAKSRSKLKVPRVKRRGGENIKEPTLIGLLGSKKEIKKEAPPRIGGPGRGGERGGFLGRGASLPGRGFFCRRGKGWFRRCAGCGPSSGKKGPQGGTTTYSTNELRRTSGEGDQKNDGKRKEKTRGSRLAGAINPKINKNEELRLRGRLNFGVMWKRGDSG